MIPIYIILNEIEDLQLGIELAGDNNDDELVNIYKRQIAILKKIIKKAKVDEDNRVRT